MAAQISGAAKQGAGKDQVCIGQEFIEEKSNEIPTGPGLLERMDIKGCVVTWDALNTQKGYGGSSHKRRRGVILRPRKRNMADRKTGCKDMQILKKTALGILKPVQGIYGQSLTRIRKTIAKWFD